MPAFTPAAARLDTVFSARWGRLVAWVLVAGGVVLRVVVWAQARSVYQDEVALLRNFLERGYAGLFQPLGHYQYAPPFFSGLLKATMTIFGNGELAIRLVPLLAGCAMLGVFAWVALRWLPPWWAALAVATVAFSSLYLDYATICKQYSTDSLVAVGLLALAERQLRRPALTPAAALGWAALGAALVWASMPAVFGLAGVGLALAWAYRRALPGRTLWLLLLMGACWVASFLLYFKLLLQADAQSSYLQNYHREAFLAFPPRSAAEWDLLGTQLGGLADKGFGKTVLAMVLAGIGVLAGTWRLLCRPTAHTWLLLAPVLSCLAASALRYYSLQPRLMLFWLPLALLLVLLGLSALGSRIGWVNAPLLTLVFVVLTNQQRLKFFVVPLQADFADVRGAFAYVAARQQPGETAFIYFNEEEPAYYYLHLHPHPIVLREVVQETYRPTPHDDEVQQDLLALAATGHGRVWITYDRPDFWLRDWAAQHGTVSQLAEFHRGYAFLWESN